MPALVARRSSQQSNRRRAAGVGARVASRSSAFGQMAAATVLQRARADGRAGIRGRTYATPTRPGRWAPATGKSAVQPFWGTLRPFAMSGSSSCRPAPPVAFSTATSSAFRSEALAVRDAAATMTMDERSSALFWADLPGRSATPPGHWLQLAAQLVRDEALPLDVAVETMMLAGLAAHDAFVACWEAKYHWNVLRPEAYLRAHVDAAWTPLLETPSFPEYPSGHSAVSQAVASVLAAQLGDRAFVDRTRVAAGLGSRAQSSLLDAAEEAAQSRLFGGIHFPMGKSAGLAQGDCVADAVLGLLSTTP
ncbi:MAG: hypothetical protein RL199_2343 [Pseudomonadota bacterium]